MFSHRDIGIDLGTANTLVYVQGKGIVVREPSVVAVRTDTNTIEAVGDDAKQMIGRTPGNLVAIRPLRSGVIADFEITATMIRHFIRQAGKAKSIWAGKPRMMICVPSGITSVEKRAIIDAAIEAGAKHAQTIEEPLAAAIGAGLPVSDPIGSLVVDIGGGTTDIALMSLGGIVTSRSLRIGGDKMDEDIVHFIKRKHNVLIGERTAEELKINIGTAGVGVEEKTLDVRGRDLLTGLPRTVKVSSEEISEAIRDSVVAIVDAVKATLENSPPELAADVMDSGIVLTGGGALLPNFDQFLSEETKIPVVVAENPLDCVAVGAGKALDNYDVFRNTISKKTRKSAHQVPTRQVYQI